MRNMKSCLKDLIQFPLVHFLLLPFLYKNLRRWRYIRVFLFRKSAFKLVKTHHFKWLTRRFKGGKVLKTYSTWCQWSQYLTLIALIATHLSSIWLFLLITYQKAQLIAGQTYQFHFCQLQNYFLTLLLVPLQMLILTTPFNFS